MSALDWVVWYVAAAFCLGLLIGSWRLMKRAEETYDAAEAVLEEARIERQHAANVNARWQG